MALALSIGCGGALGSRSPLTLAALRQQADTAPGDTLLQRRLAAAELFAPGGRSERALVALEHALAEPADLRVLLMWALHSDLHGHPDQALEAYLRSIHLAAGSQDRLAPDIAEVAMAAVSQLEEGVTDYAGRVRAGLEPVLARLAPPARQLALQVLFRLALRQGDRARADRLLQQAGCIRAWRIAGPFGPYDLLGFDAQHPASPGRMLADRYDLGPGRGLRHTRTARTGECRLSLGDGPLAAAGTTYAQALLQLSRSGPYVLRLQTPNAVEAFVDGRSVLRLDRRVESLPNVVLRQLDLEAGSHRLTLKLSSRHHSPVASVSVSPGQLPGEHATPRASVEQAFEHFVHLARIVGRGDTVTARELLRRQDPSLATAIALLYRAALALSDPLMPGNVRRDTARRALKASRERDPGLWFPTLWLARLDAANGRDLEAIAALREASKRWPHVLPVRVALIGMLNERGWHAEEEQRIADARAAFPEACTLVAAQLAAARRRGRAAEARRLSNKLKQCDARSSALHAALMRQRRWDDARAELARLDALTPKPNAYASLLEHLELARRQGNRHEAARLLKTLYKRYPRSTLAVRERIDALLARGRRDAALSFLTHAIDREPAAMGSLHHLRRSLGGDAVLEGYRADSNSVLRDFERSGRSYDAPQVLLFDYMMTRVFSDGSSLELVHTIHRVQSQEAVNDLGEVKVPRDARVLKLHTIKPDGRRIEPDSIAGKDTISLPKLKPGDYVEFEYVRSVEPPGGCPGGYLGPRFFFQSFEVPFDHS
ncbi:MAG: hypothetical protein MJD61_14410, partial [Proteobacteria bacterium]|nr:hypothetical protein [Pseudomonadota bacterium]